MLIYVKERRLGCNMTQEELAARLGVDRSCVTNWEIGARTPTTDKLPALAAALGCGIEELFRPPQDQTAREEAS